jgi:hypothetical protein
MTLSSINSAALGPGSYARGARQHHWQTGIRAEAVIWRSGNPLRHSLPETPIAADGQIGNIVSGVFTPVLAKHSKNFRIVGTVQVGVDRIGMQRNF